jgi:hypothetical protein
MTLKEKNRHIQGNIDAESIVGHADINADYTIRPEPEETLTALKRLL